MLEQVSPLKEASMLKKSGKKKGRSLVAGVILTSLVDAFSILVVYLLVSFSNSGEIIYLSKDMQLPVASYSTELQRKTLVKVEKDRYFIEEKEVSVDSLVAVLVEIRQSLAKAQLPEDDIALTVQADKRLKFSVLNNIIRAGGHAGFSNIQFAVLAN